MILEEETFEAYGYEVWELKPQSHNPILAACDECGKVRITSKNCYHSLCNSCAQKGKNNPNFGVEMLEEQKALISATLKYRYLGKKNPMFGKKHTEESRLLMRKNHIDNKGKKHYNYGKRGEDANGFKGGNKATFARSRSKRRRELGFNILMPLKEGEVFHHVTNSDVLGIPVKIHQHFSGRKREKHRALILQWLKVNDKTKYNLVLFVLTNTYYPNH